MNSPNHEQTDDDPYDNMVAECVEHYHNSIQAGETIIESSRLELFAPREVQERIHHCKTGLRVLASVVGALSRERSDSTANQSVRRIGPFEILREIGAGGFGIVYQAFDPRTKREVALKVPRFEVLGSAELASRFQQEAQAAAKLDHPNIVPVLEAGTDGLLPYIASAYYPGEALSAWLKERTDPVPPQQAAALIKQLAEAVDHAHRRGVLHRDIKPSNILLVPSEGAKADCPALDTVTPKLMDFGLAKLISENQDMTQTGALLGTLRYMSPEQAMGRIREIGPTTDVYGLGAVLYELLTGRPPFVADSDVEVLRQIPKDEPSEVRRLRPEVSRDLDTICQKCLEKGPARRYSTAQALADDLGRFLRGEPIAARSVTRFERGAKWAKRNPLWAALWAVVATALAGIIAALAWSNITVTRERDRATASERRSREYAYSADIRLAQDAWDRSTPTEAISLLERYIPRAGEDDLREIEWHYLWDNAHRYSKVIAKQPSPVFSLAVSRDEKMFVTGARDGYLRVWSREPNRLVTQFRGDDVGDINKIIFSPDGNRMYTAGDDHKIKIWRTGDWSLQHTLEGHNNWIGALALSADGEWLASGDADGRVLLWNAQDGALKGELYRHKGEVKCVQFRPNNPWLVSFCDEGEYRIWDYAGNRAIPEFPDGTFEGPPGGVGHAVFHPTGDWLYGSAHALAIWDFRGTRQAKLAAERPKPWGGAIAISPKGKWLISGGDTDAADLYVCDAGQIKELATTLHGHSSKVWALAVLADEQTALSGSDDGTVRAWQFHNSFPTNSSHYVGSTVEALAWSPTRDVLLVGLHGGEVIVTNDVFRTDGRSLGRQEHSTVAFAFAADGQRFMAIDSDGEVCWGDTEANLEQSQFRIAADISQARLNSRGTFLMYTQANDFVVVDATAGTEQWRFQHPQRITGFEIVGREAFTACNDGRLRCFELTSGILHREVSVQHGELRSLDYAPVSNRLLLGYQDKTLQIVDSENGRELNSISYTDVRRAFFVSSDRRLLTIDEQHMSLLNANNGHPLLKWNEDVDWRMVAMNRDRTTLAARSQNNHVAIVRLRAKKE